VAVQITGTQRVAIVSLIAFFAIGLVLLYLTDVKKAIIEAGNEVPAKI
jgi:UMF1 family MFS transporter